MIIWTKACGTCKHIRSFAQNRSSALRYVSKLNILAIINTPLARGIYYGSPYWSRNYYGGGGTQNETNETQNAYIGSVSFLDEFSGVLRTNPAL